MLKEPLIQFDFSLAFSQSLIDILPAIHIPRASVGLSLVFPESLASM